MFLIPVILINGLPLYMGIVCLFWSKEVQDYLIECKEWHIKHLPSLHRASFVNLETIKQAEFLKIIKCAGMVITIGTLLMDLDMAFG